jgi:hypothetical protein
MQITNTPYVNHAESVQQSALSTIMNDGQATNATKNTETDTVVISSAGRNAEAKWKEIAQKYDVTNMSGNEVISMAENRSLDLAMQEQYGGNSKTAIQSSIDVINILKKIG